MAKTPFESSKTALAFAAITLFCAMAMVGTSEDGGMLSQVVDRFGNKPDYAKQEAEARAKNPEGTGEAAAEGEDVAGWYDSEPRTVFGDYNGDETARGGSADSGSGSSTGSSSAPGGSTFAAAPGGAGPGIPASSPMNAPLAPGALPSE